MHRAVEKKDTGDGTYSFVTWGDNNGWPDGREVRESDIVGRYLAIKVPWLGNIVLFFAPFERKVAFVALGIIVLAIIEVSPSVRRRLERGDDEASLYK